MTLIVGALWSPNLMRPPPPAWTVYSNVKGQIRRVVLADKSVLRLNGASQVRVVYEDADRRLAIGQAEAALAIRPSPDRPFLISSGDRVIEIGDGEINILRETSPNGAHTEVTIRRGQARIYPVNRAAEAVATRANQQASWTDGQDRLDLRPVNADNAFAWESHRLAYDKAPLSEVVADLNRYVARPIRIADPSLAGLTYTGVLELQGEEAMLRKLAETLPIEARTSNAEIVIRRPGPKPKKKPAPALMQSLMTMSGGKPELLPKPAPPPKAP
jgi:transmembrane sensor